MEKRQRNRRDSLSNSFFFEDGVDASRMLVGSCDQGSVSERRLAANHSVRYSYLSDRASVSERRLAANHSPTGAAGARGLVYPSGDWPRTTA